MPSMERLGNERVGLYGPMDSWGQKTQMRTWVPYHPHGHHLRWELVRVHFQTVLRAHKETHPGLRCLVVRCLHDVVG